MSSPLSTYLQLTPAQIEEKKLNQNPAFLDHLLGKLHEHIAKKGKILLITLTKKSSEEVTSFLIAQGFKAFYLHSEIATIENYYDENLNLRNRYYCLSKSPQRGNRSPRGNTDWGFGCG